MREGLAAEVEWDASQHAVGGIARVCFFLFKFIQLKFVVLLLCLDQWTQHDQTNNFSFWKRPEGHLLLYFCSEKRPGYVANAPGALFRNCFMKCPGGRLLSSLRYYSNTPDRLYETKPARDQRKRGRFKTSDLAKLDASRMEKNDPTLPT